MQKTAEFIEDRIKWRAAQCNLPNKSVFFFENLSAEAKTKYLTYFNEENSGKIILIFTDSKSNWTVLGTKKIIGFDGTKLNSANLDSIQDLGSKKWNEHFLKAEAGQTKPKKINKQNECEFLVTDFDGKETVFITEKGSDFFSLWNIVLMITRLYK